MDSPTGRADDTFHWGTTLWHEMAHVFTLEATNHLVPRWFSEGVSVWEEWSTGPLPGRHIPPPVFAAIKEDKFLPVAELDRGFIRPTYEAQVIVSYMQAGLICEYIAGRFGQQALERMLDEFARRQGHGASHPGRAQDLAGAVRRGLRRLRRQRARRRSSPASSAGRRSKPRSSRPSRRRIGGSSSRRPPRPSSSSPTTSTKAARTSPRRAAIASSTRRRCSPTRCSSTAAAAATIPTH